MTDAGLQLFLDLGGRRRARPHHCPHGNADRPKDPRRSGIRGL